MLYRLVRPMKRKGSSKAQFVKRIPSDLRGKLSGMKLAIPVGGETVPITITDRMETIRCSLRSSEPHEVKQRQADAAAYIEALFKSVRETAPVSLTHRQAVALSGRLYRSWASDFERDTEISLEHVPGVGWVRGDPMLPRETEAAYQSTASQLGRLHGADFKAIEKVVGPLVDRLLLEEGIASVDQSTREMLLLEFLEALREGMEARRRKAGGDYSPDPRSERFPEWHAPSGIKGKPAQRPEASITLTGLIEGWWREAMAAGRSESTHESYKKAVTSLSVFLGQNDAARVTPEDVIRFKDYLLAAIPAGRDRPLDARTVNDSYLSGLKSVFGWAVANRKLPSNPAQGIRIKVPKKRKLRASWFTPEEIRALLTASSKVARGPREPPQRFALKRWVPWLCAYTGARVGEIVQLRKEDIRWEENGWVVTITPEAGTVKDKERRDVPLHPHLIDLGFLEFVHSAPKGHLFMWSGTGRAAWRSAKNRVTAFVRTAVKDPHVQPNHGWRHTFKTIGSEAGIQDKVLDAICGHDPRTVGEGYGGVTLKAKWRAVELFPRYEFNRGRSALPSGYTAIRSIC